MSKMFYRHFSRGSVIRPSSVQMASRSPDLHADFVGLRDKARYVADAQDSPLYRFGKWLKATILDDAESARFIREQKIPMAKAQAEGVDATGGWVVPDAVAEQIISLREEYGTVRRNTLPWPLIFGGNVPRRTRSASGVWVSEGGTISEDTATSYDTAGLTAKKLAVLIKASSELEEDAIEPWAADIADNMAQALAQAEDDATFKGDGTSTYGKITGLAARLNDGAHAAGKITAASGHNTFGTIDGADLGALFGALPKRAMANAKIFCSMPAYGNLFCRLAATSGGLVASHDGDGILRATFNGWPVEICQSLPTATTTLTGQMMLAFGDMEKGVAFGERRQIVVRRMPERFADLDQVAFLATERVDINVHDVGDATSAGALVGLFAP